VRAALYYGAGDVRIEDVPEPSPGPGEVLVRVLANGLCGTDLHQYDVGPLSDAPLPIIVGHELAGEIVGVGEGVSRSRVGELVAVEPIWRCNDCGPCHDGDYNLCLKGPWHGLTGMGGGLCELTVVRDEMAWAVPDGIDPMDAAVVEPMAVAFHGIERAAVTPGDRAVVLGAGPIGLGAYLGLRAEGVDQVAVVEPSPERRAAAEAVGAPAVLDPTDGSATEAIAELFGGAGATVAIDAAGTQGSFDTAVAVAAPKARIVLVAAFAESVQFNPLAVLQRETRIDMAFAYRGTFGPVLRHMAAGRYPTSPWVRHMALDDVVEAYGMLHRREAVKLLIDI